MNTTTMADTSKPYNPRAPFILVCGFLPEALHLLRWSLCVIGGEGTMRTYS